MCKTMRAVLTAASVALLGAWGFPAELTAQRTVSTSVDSFNGLFWGASAEEVEMRYGSAVQTDTLGNGIVVLAYRETVLDLPATTMYAVLPDKGLVKGQHAVKFDFEAGDCEGQYRRIRDDVAVTYPLITPVENANHPYDMDFCSALREGQGGWATQWSDPSTGSVITVIAHPGSDEVKLIYESALFLEWLDEARPPEDP